MALSVAMLAAPHGRGRLEAQALPPLDEHRVRVFGVAEGLPSSDVRGVTQAADGFVIVATARGLVRFDGFQFEAIATPEIDPLDWIHRDRQGRVWIRSWGNRLGVLKDGRFRLLPDPPGYPVSESRVPARDGIRGAWLTRDGSIWFGGYRGLLHMPADNSDGFTRYAMADGLPSDTVLGVFDLESDERIVVTRHRLSRVEADSSRPGGMRFHPFGPDCLSAADPLASASRIRLTCAGADGGLQYLDYEHGTFTRAAAGPSGTRRSTNGDGAGTPSLADVRPALMDDAGLLAGAGAPDHRPFFGNYRLHPGLRAPALGLPLPNQPLFGIELLARDGTLWRSAYLPNDARAFLVREREGARQWIVLRDHLEFERIQHLFEDAEGNLWVGTERGLLQLSERTAFALTGTHGLADGFTVPTLETRDGTVWIGTWGGGLHRFGQGRLLARYTEGDGLPADHVRALYEDRAGVLWIGTNRGTAALREGRIVRSLRSDYETRAFAEAAGRLWIATGHGLLAGARDPLALGAVDTVLAGSFWALRTASDGALWIGGEGGLFRFRDGRARPVTDSAGAPLLFVTSIAEDDQGSIWLGTLDAGLLRYRDGAFVSITTHDGLPANGVWAVLDDGLGGVWLSSDEGISRVDREALRALADARARGIRAGRLDALRFTETEGLPSRESNRASPAAVRLSDGRLLFNGVAGAVVIDPAPNVLRLAVVTWVRRVYADGTPITVPASGAPARVPAGTRQLHFDFVAPMYAAPNQSRYRYRLEGYDDAWVDAGVARRASYTGLHPGRYIFHVQGANGRSDWGRATSWSFSVAPLLWQALWFRILAAAALCGGLASAYRYRVRKLLEVERLRLRIASDLHDDLGANLSSIALLTQMLERQDRFGERERRQLARIGLAARETMGGLRDVIWLVDPAHDSLDVLFQRLRSTAASLLDGTDWTLRTPDTVPAKRLDMSLVRNIFLVFKEALSNAVRHGRAHRIGIDVGIDGGFLSLRVEDDGAGFDSGAVGRGNGLANMRRRAEEVGGRIEIHSTPGAGTRVAFTVRLP